MRVKFGKCIRRCKFVTILESANLLNVSTDNGLYTVDIPQDVDVNEIFNQILVQGYADFSEYEYSNM